jgi:hypothetical protein
MATALKDRIQNALDEARMLILGAQVLLGFQFRSVFESKFERLPDYAKNAELVGLALMLIATGLLLAPGAYHRIVEQGEDTPALELFTTRIMGLTLLPFGFGLGLDLFLAINTVAGLPVSIMAGVATVFVALFFWYGIELYYLSKRAKVIERERAMKEEDDKEKDQQSSLADKIKHVLTEARVVLPGAQALLGFQFATFLMEGFDKLPAALKYVHIASLSMVALAIIFLITPASYHRLVERGEETAHFHRFASSMVLASMIPLALGIAGDVYVVLMKVTESQSFSSITSGAILILFYGLWFGLPLYVRGHRTIPGGHPASRVEVVK